MDRAGKTRRLAAALLALAPLAARAEAASGPDTPRPVRCTTVAGGFGLEGEAARWDDLAGERSSRSFFVREGGARAAPGCEVSAEDGAARAHALEVRSLPLRVHAVWNSMFPSGSNDGALWAGRGGAASLAPGLHIQAGRLTVALAPEITWSQNRSFVLPPSPSGEVPAFRNPWYPDTLDLPLRPGPHPVTAVGGGQSYVQVAGWGVRAGLSTENVWLGPGVENSLVLTNNAAGFPHVYLASLSPFDIWVGRLEFHATWGRLERSRYAPERGARWLNALGIAFEPRGAPGLYFGAGRAFVEPRRSLERSGYLPILGPPFADWKPGGNDPKDNQIAALWFRWVPPSYRFELYGEWGRDDFPISLAGLLREPGRSQAWVLGLRRAFTAGGRDVRFAVETTRLHDPPNPGDVPTWYTHVSGTDWTHGGQLLGAAAGPGGDALRVALDLVDKDWISGAYLERLARNEDVYFTKIALVQPSAHDVAVTLGLRHVRTAGAIKVGADLAWTYRWARDFLGNEQNVRLLLDLALPSGTR